MNSTNALLQTGKLLNDDAELLNTLTELRGIASLLTRFVDVINKVSRQAEMPLTECR